MGESTAVLFFFCREDNTDLSESNQCHIEPIRHQITNPAIHLITLITFFCSSILSIFYEELDQKGNLNGPNVSIFFFFHTS